MTAPAHAHAANRVPVVVSRPGRPTVTGRLMFLPGPNARGRRGRRGGAEQRARVVLPSGAVISCPVEAITVIEPEDR